MRLSYLLSGARRGVMISKRGRQTFYKGRGCKPTGLPTNKGGYIVYKNRIPEIVVPDLEGFSLKPYVSYRAPYVIGKPITPEDIVALYGQSSSSS